MKVIKTEFDEVKIIEPVYHEDFRGYYCETYSRKTLLEHNIDIIFSQDNHSFTHKKGTIRGIHFQNNPFPQTKLVRCTRGLIIDVVVDLRKTSKTYKKFIIVELSEQNKRQILIPCGFGHAFLTMSDNTEVLYKVDNYYDKNLDRSIIWNDPEINIPWPISTPILSDKDRNAPTLANSDVNF